MPVSSASGLSNHPGHEGQSYRLPNTRKKHARRAGASDHSHGSNLMGIGNNNPPQNRDPPCDRRTSLNINHAMCDERFGERGPSGSWCFSPLGKPGGWRPPFVLNPTCVARVCFGTKNGASRALENCLAMEFRRPLSGQNRNQNTCPRLNHRDGFLIRKNPPDVERSVDRTTSRRSERRCRGRAYFNV
jgi:hypothetical protein